jgi:hypothetical protein
MLWRALSAAQLAGHAISAEDSGHYMPFVVSDFLLVNRRGSD